jgi:hypothetical protein
LFTSKFVDNGATFFKLKYTDWISKSDFPFGEIKDRFGLVSNIDECVKMIAFENSIDPDGQDFGKGVSDAMKQIEN